MNTIIIPEKTKRAPKFLSLSINGSEHIFKVINCFYNATNCDGDNITTYHLYKLRTSRLNVLGHIMCPESFTIYEDKNGISRYDFLGSKVKNDKPTWGLYEMQNDSLSVVFIKEIS